MQGGQDDDGEWEQWPEEELMAYDGGYPVAEPWTQQEEMGDVFSGVDSDAISGPYATVPAQLLPETPPLPYVKHEAMQYLRANELLELFDDLVLMLCQRKPVDVPRCIVGWLDERMGVVPPEPPSAYHIPVATDPLHRPSLPPPGLASPPQPPPPSASHPSLHSANQSSAQSLGSAASPNSPPPASDPPRTSAPATPAQVYRGLEMVSQRQHTAPSLCAALCARAAAVAALPPERQRQFPRPFVLLHSPEELYGDPDPFGEESVPELPAAVPGQWAAAPPALPPAVVSSLTADQSGTQAVAPTPVAATAVPGAATAISAGSTLAAMPTLSAVVVPPPSVGSTAADLPPGGHAVELASAVRPPSPPPQLSPPQPSPPQPPPPPPAATPPPPLPHAVSRAEVSTATEGPEEALPDVPATEGSPSPPPITVLDDSVRRDFGTQVEWTEEPDDSLRSPGSPTSLSSPTTTSSRSRPPARGHHRRCSSPAQLAPQQRREQEAQLPQDLLHIGRTPPRPITPVRRSVQVLVLFYSTFGHLARLAGAVADGCIAHDVDVRLRRVPELMDAQALAQIQADKAQAEFSYIPVAQPQELAEYHCILFGFSTRFGTLPFQVQQFLEEVDAECPAGFLEGKVGGVFTSTGTQHGGQEAACLHFHKYLLSQGMLVLGLPPMYRECIPAKEVHGCGPYGASTITAPLGGRKASEPELDAARLQGKFASAITRRLFLP